MLSLYGNDTKGKCENDIKDKYEIDIKNKFCSDTEKPQ